MSFWRWLLLGGDREPAPNTPAGSDFDHDVLFDEFVDILAFARVEASCPMCGDHRTSMLGYDSGDGVMVRCQAECAGCGAGFLLECDAITFSMIAALVMFDRLAAKRDLADLSGDGSLFLSREPDGLS